MRAFWKGGYANTTVSRLESAAGIRRSSLYHVFGTKEGMYVVTLRHYRGRLQEAMFRPLEEGTRGLDDIIAFFQRIERGLPDILGVENPASGCMVVNALAEFGATDEAVRREGQALSTSFLGAMGAAVARAVKRGEIARKRARNLPELLLLVATAINFAARGGADRAQRRIMAGIAIAMVRADR